MIINSFISWIGGKKLLRKEIIALFPSDIERYIEVFGGAGWVLFGAEKHADFEVFNDINGNLINLFRCVKYHCEELQKELKWVLDSRETFFDYRAQNDTQGLTDIQRAARYFYMIRMSFGTDLRSFNTGKKMAVSCVEFLDRIRDRLMRVKIENRDFMPVVKTYDRENALFYLDPPYYDAEKYYEGFPKDDHYRLFEVIQKVQGRFVLSYNDHPFITDLWKNFNIRHTARQNNLNKKSGEAYREVIITNF